MKRFFLLAIISIAAVLLCAGVACAEVPLIEAVKAGDINKVKALIDKGVDLELNDKYGSTALMLAVGNGQTEIAKLLIDKGVNMDTQKDGWKKDGGTALMIAAQNGHTEAAKLLINKGADVNVKTIDGWTALMIAAENGHTEAAKLLIDKGADIEAKTKDGLTALHYAVAKGQTEIAKLLIDKGADIEAKNNGGMTALMWAAGNGHIEIAKLLIDKGANVNAKENDEFGITALIFAAVFGHTEIASLLIDKGADVIYAIASLEGRSDAKSATGARLLKMLREDQKQAAATTPKATSKAEAKSIPIKKKSIDVPVFKESEKIIGNNDLAVIIGIEGYQSLPKSDYSFDDAMLVKEYMKALGFKERNIELLGDERATKSGIEKTIEAWLVNKAKPGSRVFVYYSGHGAPDPATGDAYLVPYDGDPNYLAQTGYPLKRLYASLGHLPASEVVVVLDACFSGAGGRSVIAKGARPMMVTAEKLSVPQNMVVLSSTQGAQISTSSPEKGHGVFTYYFLKALREGKRNAVEIYDYVKPLVEDEAKQLNVQQSPSMMPQTDAAKGRFSLRR